MTEPAGDAGTTCGFSNTNDPMGEEARLTTLWSISNDFAAVPVSS